MPFKRLLHAAAFETRDTIGLDRGSHRNGWNGLYGLGNRGRAQGNQCVVDRRYQARDIAVRNAVIFDMGGYDIGGEFEQGIGHRDNLILKRYGAKCDELSR